MRKIQPLKTSFLINEDAGFVQDQILDRVNSEANLTWAISPIQFQTHKDKIRYAEDNGWAYLASRIIKRSKLF